MHFFKLTPLFLLLVEFIGCLDGSTLLRWWVFVHVKLKRSKILISGPPCVIGIPLPCTSRQKSHFFHPFSTQKHTLFSCWIEHMIFAWLKRKLWNKTVSFTLVNVTFRYYNSFIRQNYFFRNFLNALL